MNLVKEEQNGGGTALLILVTKIRRFQEQPRKYFNPVSLQALADSIKQDGQEQPLTVMRIPTDSDGCEFELIDGERRWRAAQLANMTEVRALIDTCKDKTEQFKKAVILNCNRDTQTLLETAWAVEYLKKHGKSIEEILTVFGKKSKQWVDQYLKILTLHPDVLKLLGPETPEDERLALNTALPLADLPKEDQPGLAAAISQNGLSIVQAKHLIQNTAATKGLRRRGRQGEEFKSTLTFFKRTNQRIELLVDHADERMRALLTNRKHYQRKEFLHKMKDCYDNLGVVIKAIEKFDSENPSSR
jgi:ParB family chromosome partitioning protein